MINFWLRACIYRSGLLQSYVVCTRLSVSRGVGRHKPKGLRKFSTGCQLPRKTFSAWKNKYTLQPGDRGECVRLMIARNSSCNSSPHGPRLRIRAHRALPESVTSPRSPRAFVSRAKLAVTVRAPQKLYTPGQTSLVWSVVRRDTIFFSLPPLFPPIIFDLLPRGLRSRIASVRGRLRTTSKTRVFALCSSRKQLFRARIHGPTDCSFVLVAAAMLAFDRASRSRETYLKVRIVRQVFSEVIFLLRACCQCADFGHRPRHIAS